MLVIVVCFFLLLVGRPVHSTANAYQCFELKTLNTEACSQCEYGSDCVLSGRTNVTCRCIERCYSYGDSVDSQKVCNADGQTYDSICHLRKYSCEAKKEPAVRFVGKCGRCLNFLGDFLGDFSLSKSPKRDKKII